MLIRDAELDLGTRRADLRIADGRIAAVAPSLAPQAGEAVIEARGAALIPGLRDHHLHLWAYAASLDSLVCGPTQVHDVDTLREALRRCDAALAPDRWLRGIGYHPSVAGEIDRTWLDACVGRRPLRIQHRSGRLWILNTAALRALHVDESQAGVSPLERDAQGRFTGRLYDADDWLRARIGRQRPDLRRASRRLAAHGITALTDTTPDNGPEQCAEFEQAQRSEELLQDLCVMGDARLDLASDVGGSRLRRGAHKFHLHEHKLPAFESLVAAVRASHAAQRGAAFHCVTRTELIFALAVLEEVGSDERDRIEHAGVVPPELVVQLVRRGVTVVTQPGFVHERGEAYLADVEAEDQPWLYRLRSLLDAGIPLAGSSDAPFGDANPWSAMAAAVSRQTAGGRVLGTEERLTPEQALRLFTSDIDAPGRRWPRLSPGEPADLCLLPVPWRAVRNDLAAVRPAAVFLRGHRIDR